ncbi:hypothetical protein PLICRDRAFT_48426 [Plicaturopsis crispa FD-325 SS-3]|nr:hypothetical protein PLICRDRAFT_48426 [Plicaturopsis crispa FD-325 SS-3]
MDSGSRLDRHTDEDAEDAALLPSRSRSRDTRVKITPLPKLQISILLFLQLAEPITTHTIFPFINELVNSLDVTGGDPRKTAYYVGVIESVFFLTESATILQWSRLSDYTGRKPILLLGVFGLCVSMLAFGLSRTFWALVVARSLAGLLCANAGVRKSTLGELTDATNRGQGAALMPITWSFGATIGPFIGGTLSRPQDHFPNTFRAPFWRDYPYFLPCATSAMFSAIAFLVASLFLKETVKKGRPSNMEFEPDDHTHDESVPSARSQSLPPSDLTPNQPIPLRRLMIYPVILSISNYALLAVLGSATDALQSVFYATPIEYGGLGLPPSTIGRCLSAFGFFNGFLQAFFFAHFVRRWGPKRVFLFGIGTFVPVFALFPIINGLSWIVWLFLAVQLVLCVAMNMCYSCMFIFITSSVPNSRSLGAVNGLAQTAVAVARAVGPAMATSLFGLSIQKNLLGGYAVYAVLIVLVGCISRVAVRLPEDTWEDTET